VVTVTAARRASTLPRINDAAWHGPIGEAVQMLAPCTEADSVAVLAISLALVGTIIGDGPHVRLGGVNHPARVWPLVVGSTGGGRKGTAQATATYFVSSFNSFTREWLAARTRTGLSTGEGLIAALTPPTDPEDDRPKDGRLIAYEPEFGRVLAVMRRDGATLGTVLRSLWETDRAAVLTRGQPLTVVGAHLVVPAHISPRELRLKLAEADLAGGTLNRFLPLLAERSQLLPIEPELPDLTAINEPLGDRLRNLPSQLMRRSPDADQLWTVAYQAMAHDEGDGLLGAVLARGPAQTMRLAMIYALADGAVSVIGVDHLRAALALWKYCADSARVLFGDLSGSSDLDRLADFIASASEGRTATEVSGLFGRNKPSAELSKLLDELVNLGDVVREEDRKTGGRPTTRYLWVGLPRDTLGEILAGIY
jgi:uncharacterized protein DUF3987